MDEDDGSGVANLGPQRRVNWSIGQLVNWLWTHQLTS
jgi:hypothetical protein